MDVIRWGALGLMGSGVMWVATGIFDSFGLFTDFTVVALPMAALVLLVVGMEGLHALQKASYGILGLVGFLTVVAGALAQVLGLIFLAAGIVSALLWLASPIGPLVMLIGWVLYGAATLQARVLPRWCGVLFIVSLPVAMILESYWDLLFGLSGDIFLGLVLLILS
jgi:hypothetical protein